jgi:hypothetical protein
MSVEILPAHSKIGASSYSRWSKTHGGCPGSVRLSAGLVSPESEYAKEGTLAHEIAATILENYFFGTKKPTPPIEKLPLDMMPAVKIYVDYIKAQALEANANVKAGHILIEHKFDMSKSVYKGLFGTSDAVIYFPLIKKLLVADYKHGSGIAVEVEDNLQLQYYALGALLSTGFPCDQVEIVVVQPRINPEPQKWIFSSIELLDFAADLAADAAATEDPEAPINPGKHCRFCPAAAAKCTVIKEKAVALAKLEFKPQLSYDPDKLAEALKFVPAMEAWAKQVREFAYAEAMAGRYPPGWKLVAKRATRKWITTEDVIVDYMLEATKLPPDDLYERSLKTPAQMEKLVSKQIGEGLRKFMESVSSGYNLVPEDDSRPAAKIEAASEFTKIEGES